MAEFLDHESQTSENIRLLIFVIFDVFCRPYRDYLSGLIVGIKINCEFDFTTLCGCRTEGDIEKLNVMN